MLEQILSYLHNKKLYLWLAENYLREQKLEKATSVLHDAVKHMPDDIEVRSWLSIRLLSQGNYSEALTNLEYMIANWPTNQKRFSNNWLANCHALLAKCQIHLRDFINAEKHLDIAQDIAPWDLDACNALIDLYYCTNRFDEILSMLDRYIAAYPQVYPPYIWKATHLHFRCYDPTNALKWYEKANTLVTPEMMEYSDRFFSSENMIRVFVIDYSEALIQCGEQDQAWNLIQSYKNNPAVDNISFQKMVVAFYLKTESYLAAEQITLSLIKQNKNLHAYWELLARVQTKQNKLANAQISIEQALLLNSELISTYDALAEIQVTQSEWKLASATYQKLITFSPLEPEWLENCGYCYKNIGEFKKACELYEKVVSLDPLDAIAWANLGEIYFELNQKELALSACEHALGFNRLTEDKRERTEKMFHKLKNEA